MTRNTNTLRDILFDELDALRDGSADPRRATAVAKLATQIISTAKVELDYHKLSLRAKAAGEDFVLGSMDLGTHVESAGATSRIEHQRRQTQIRDERAAPTAVLPNTLKE